MKQNGKESTWFIQIKHKEVPNKNLVTSYSLASRVKSDFSLYSYFLSWKCLLERHLVGGSNEDQLFFKDFLNANFVIFTNSEMQDNDPILGKCPFADIGLLSTQCYRERNIKFDQSRDTNLFIHMLNDRTYTLFAERLYLCTGQRNEADMNDIIEKEIIKAHKGTDLSFKDVKFITAQYYEYLNDWKKCPEYLTKAHISRILSKIRATTAIDNSNGLNVSNIQFNHQLLAPFRDCLNQNGCRLLCIMCDAATPLLGMAILKQLKLIEGPNKLLKSSNLQNSDVEQYILDLWKTPMKLFIECDNGIGDITNIIKKLLASSINNCIVLILSQNFNNLSIINSQLPQRKLWHCKCNLQSLAASTQDVLKQKIIYFQGYETTFSGLSGYSPQGLSKMSDVFDSSTITEMFTSDVSIGMKLNKNVDFYVSRVLTRQSTVEQDVFQYNAFFAISNITLDGAQKMFSRYFDYIDTANNVLVNYIIRGKLIKIIILENEYEKNYSLLCQRLPKPVHWLRVFKSKLSWVRSSDEIIQIENCLTNTYEYKATENMLKIDDKVVIVSAEPGMGKSTLLAHMAAETKKFKPNMWVVVVSLHDFNEHFRRQDFMNDPKNSVKGLLSAAAGIDKNSSSLTVRLFDYCYSKGEMIVILDGFDEICPFYKQQGLLVVQTLQASAVSRIWIATRPVLKTILEKVTNTLAYTIKPFGPKDQLRFLQKYWISKIPDLPSEQLEDYTKNILKLLQESMDDDLQNFTGIPLQTRIIAEVFERDLQNKTLNVPNKINFIDLFGDFVKKKMEILWSEKKKLAFIDYSDLEVLNKLYLIDLQTLALITILPADTLGELNPPIRKSKIIELKKLVNDGNEKTGMITSFQNNVPQFIHRTFAEYFTAKFFSDNIGSNSKFLSYILFNPDFKFVSYLYNRMMAKGIVLHEAILEKDVPTFDKCYENDILDKGNRSALHLAALLPGSEYFIEKLLSTGKKYYKDKVLQWEPYEYALQTKCFTNIAPIINGNSFIFDNLSQSSMDLLMTWESVLQCFIGDYIKLFIYLLSNDIGKVTGYYELIPKAWFANGDVERVTFLHLGGFYNSTSILHHLLQNNTRDSKLSFINNLDCSGHSPLHYAILRQNKEAAECLVEHGADIMLPYPNGKSPIGMVLDLKNCTIFKILLSHARRKGVDGQVLFASSFQHLLQDKSEQMVEMFSDALNTYRDLPTWNTNNGGSVFYVATMKGNVGVVKKLLNVGVDPKKPCKFGIPLQTAIYNGRIEIIEILLEWYKNLESVNLIQAIFNAMKRGYFKVISLLFERGVNLKIINDRNETLFHAMACVRVDQSNISQFNFTLRILHQCGVDYNAVNNDNVSGLNAIKAAGIDMDLTMLDLQCTEPVSVPTKIKRRTRNKGRMSNQVETTTGSSTSEDTIKSLLLLAQKGGDIAELENKFKAMCKPSEKETPSPKEGESSETNATENTFRGKNNRRRAYRKDNASKQGPYYSQVYHNSKARMENNNRSQPNYHNNISPAAQHWYNRNMTPFNCSQQGNPNTRFNNETMNSNMGMNHQTMFNQPATPLFPQGQYFIPPPTIFPPQGLNNNNQGRIDGNPVPSPHTSNYPNRRPQHNNISGQNRFRKKNYPRQP